jgi:hypothetical protein
MSGWTYWSRLSWLIFGCGRTHSFGTSSPLRMFSAAMIGVRHWYVGYVGASAVQPSSCHLVRKSCWSSPVIGGTSTPASSNASLAATDVAPASIQTPSIWPSRWM